MDKFSQTDRSTSKASKEEKQRIFDSFVKRVEDFETAMTSNAPLHYELILNPSDSELIGSESLKDSIYWKLDDYSKQYEKNLGVLKAKLTLFRFEKKGINKLLFSLSGPVNGVSYEFLEQDIPMPNLFLKRVNVIRNIILPNNYNGMICLVGGDRYGSSFFVATLADTLQRNIKTININDVLRDNNLIKNTFSKDSGLVIHLCDFDYLFSDLTGSPKIPNRELSMLRNDLLLSLNQKKNTIVISVSSALIIPNDISNMVDVVEDINNINSSEIEKYVSHELGSLDISDVNIITSLFEELPISFIIKELNYIKKQKIQSSMFDVAKYLEWKVQYYKKTRAEFNKVEGADFKIIKPTETLERVVLTDLNRSKIEMALSGIINQELIYNTWGWSEIDPNVRSIINFFGPPGTG